MQQTARQSRPNSGDQVENSQCLPNLFVADAVTYAQAPCIAASVVISAGSVITLATQFSKLSKARVIPVNVTMPGSTRRPLLPATFKHACCSLRGRYEAFCPNNPCADLCARSVNRQRYLIQLQTGAMTVASQPVEVGTKVYAAE